MEIRNHWMEDIRFTQTSNLGAGSFKPRFVLLHYTTGWSGEGSRNWLLGAAGGHAASRVSAHVVIDTDGRAWQIAPFNRPTWHAGPSRHRDAVGLNDHAIGIEFANPGWLRPAGAGRWVDSFNHHRTSQQLDAAGGFIEAPHPRVGAGSFAWPLYTEAQLRTGLAITAALIAKYGLEAVLSHEEVDTRGWKTDPGPAFPMQAFQELLGQMDAGPARFLVSATRLNLRGGPSDTADRIDPPGALPQGTEVEVLRAEGPWRFIEVTAVPAKLTGLARGLRGWVHGRYLDPAP